MTRESRRLAGIILILVPAVAFGGASLLSMILGQAPGYLDNPVRQDLWRAGHAHAGVMLILALVLLRYVDETSLRGRWLWLGRHGVPFAAILMPVGFFLSVLTPGCDRAERAHRARVRRRAVPRRWRAVRRRGPAPRSAVGLS